MYGIAYTHIIYIHAHAHTHTYTHTHNDTHKLQEKEDFLVLFHQFVEEGLFDIDLGLTETITESPEASLNNIKSRDINIIMGFFGPENARNILCLVSRSPIFFFFFF